jgi:transposase
MKRNAKFTGLDVHAATIVGTVEGQNGRVLVRTVLPTEREAVLEFFGGMRGPVHVAFEEGTQAQWLYELLEPVVAEVVVCNRRGQARTGNHADFMDSDRLAADLRKGNLKPVYHGKGDRQTLQELVHLYRGLTQDTTRVMQRIKAVYRARALATPGASVYGTEQRAAWLAKLENCGARTRVEMLLSELDVLRALRPEARKAMVVQARREADFRVLTRIPFLGPVRAALLLATLQTPWRFRRRRNLWGYAGFAVVTHNTAQFVIREGRVVRRERAPLTRGLNRNRNPVVKRVFKDMARDAARRPGPLQDWYRERLATGLDPDLALVTLARKLASITLRLWKKGEAFDPSKLTMQAS